LGWYLQTLARSYQFHISKNFMEPGLQLYDGTRFKDIRGTRQSEKKDASAKAKRKKVVEKSVTYAAAAKSAPTAPVYSLAHFFKRSAST